MRFFAFVLLLLGFTHAWAPVKVKVTATYDIYITVGKGNDGEDGPVEKAEVTLSGPNTKINPQVKTADSEGVAHFKVEQSGRYFVNIKAAGFAPYEGRVFPDKEQKVYFFAALSPDTAKKDKARIAVTVKDADSGGPVVGASIRTQRDDESYGDRMTTGADGREYVVIDLSPSTKGGLTFDVTVSHPDYEPQTKRVTANPNRITDYPVEFSLKRARDLQLFTVTVRESGTRAPIQSAKVTLDAGGNKFFGEDTGPDGTATFRVPKGNYAVKVSTSNYEEETDKVDIGSEGRVTKRTYELVKKDTAREIRRALIVSVRFKDDKGAFKPVTGATVTGPGYHTAVTDSAGKMVFLHTVPPGETITVSATSALFKPSSATVLIRDKGVMVDVRQFSRDTARGMSDAEALRKQGITGYDAVTITLEDNKVELVKKVVGQIEADNEVNPGDAVDYSVRLNYESGDTKVVNVEEVITVSDSAGRIVDRKGNVRSLSQDEPSTESYSFTPSKSGVYRIKCVVSWDGGVLWKGEKTVTVTEDRRKISLSGNVVAKKASVGLDERIDVNVNVLYESGPKDKLSLRERVELFDPKGEIVQNNLGERAFTRGNYSLRNFAITCQASGTYRLKSTILGPDGETLWTGEDRFQVTNKGKPVMQKAGQGYYKLKSKKVGHAPGPAVGQYGTYSGSISESSFNVTYVSTPPWEANANISLSYSTPPTIIKAGETIELTVQGSGSVTGKDANAIGASGKWWTEGGEIVAGKPVFVGRASDGKDYPSGSATYKIKVGSGGKLVIGNSHNGASWGSSDNWTPGTYEYEWVPNLAPPDPVKTGKPTMVAGSATEKQGSAAGSYSGSTLIPRGQSIAHAVALQIRPGTNPNTLAVSGTVAPKGGAKGFQINLSGTYYAGSNKIAGNGAMVNVSRNSWNVTFDGKMENGQAVIVLTIKQVGGPYQQIVSVHMAKK